VAAAAAAAARSSSRPASLAAHKIMGQREHGGLEGKSITDH